MQTDQLKLEDEYTYTDRFFLPEVLKDVIVDDNFVIEDAETMDLREDKILSGVLKFVNCTENEPVSYLFAEDATLRHLDNCIFREIHIPRKWKDEGVAEPNIVAKSKAHEICSYFYNFIGIIPFRVVPNKENGITIIYRDYNNARSLIIEVDNDLEIAGLVNDDKQKKILASISIKEFNFNELIRTYYER